MEYKIFGNKIFLRLDKGDDITESVRKVAKAENVTAAAVSGIGASADFTIGCFDLKAGKYREKTFRKNHEIAALTGNITVSGGEPYIHLHIVCGGRNGKTVSGHFIRGVVSLTAEIVIDTANGSVSRYKDAELNINKWKL